MSLAYRVMEAFMQVERDGGLSSELDEEEMGDGVDLGDDKQEKSLDLEDTKDVSHGRRCGIYEDGTLERLGRGVCGAPIKQ